MSAGDAQRIWFPELIEQLRAHWQPGMSFDGMVKLRNDLDSTLQRIRTEGNYTTLMVRCQKCRRYTRGAEPRVSVRAMILSTVRFEIAASDATYALEKGWAAYRRENHLDIYGGPIAPGSVSEVEYSHKCVSS